MPASVPMVWGNTRRLMRLVSLMTRRSKSSTSMPIDAKNGARAWSRTYMVQNTASRKADPEAIAPLGTPI
jgi:hypothetical protein